uniref:E3 ubiquitin-protein ligase TRIM68 n=2 Tax=Anthurium amnicola TaxID=1678845 RepID=A0A1D1Y6L2_9ARAE
MACRAIHSWTLCGLTGAFLDLVLAYFMLCGAVFAFLAAKFLGVFGLHLPCPCGGLFGHPRGPCLHRILVDYPPRIVSSIQMSVRSRFPFDSVWTEEEGSPSHFDVKFVRDGAQSNRLLEMAREEAESCWSVSNLSVVRSQNLSSGDPSSMNKGDQPETICSPWRPRGGSDVKGKGVLSSLKPRPGLRRRRRASVEQRKSSSILPSGLQMVWQGAQHSYHSTSEQMQEISVNNLRTLNSGDHLSLSDNWTPSDNIGIVGGDVPSIGSTQQLTMCKVAENDLVTCAPEKYAFERNEDNAIGILEQALKEEQPARSALYLELEKERSAAATAADEAMAMILRLQKEKASVEMEARQYQRMVEEKSAYDEEEMNILKEIIVRREREKHFLEKEVEMYRQMILSGEGTIEQPSHNMIDTIGQTPNCSFEFADGPEVMLQQFSEPIIEKETSKRDNVHIDDGPATVVATMDDIEISDCVSYDKPDHGGEHSAEDKQNSANDRSYERPSWGLVEDRHQLKHVNDERFCSFDQHHVKILERSDECLLDFQEKGTLTVDVYPSPHQSQTSEYGDDSGLHKLNQSWENGFHSEASVSVDGFGERGFETFGRLPCANIDQENHQDKGEGGCRSYASHLEAEQGVHDVHVIDDKSCEEGNEKENGFSWIDGASVSSRTDDIKTESDGSKKVDTSRAHSSDEQDVCRSSSDLRRAFLHVNTSHDSSSLSELRRNSTSAVDKERLKLETEVEFLIERLQVIQRGREKLNFSVENMVKENFQLQVLEEIASQLREIRQLTEPGKAIRQVSLPPSSSKVNLKKRRCRSVPRGVDKNT